MTELKQYSTSLLHLHNIFVLCRHFHTLASKLLNFSVRFNFIYTHPHFLMIVNTLFYPLTSALRLNIVLFIDINN